MKTTLTHSKILPMTFPFDYWLDKLPISMHEDIYNARTGVEEFESLTDFILFGFYWRKTVGSVKFWNDVVNSISN